MMTSQDILNQLNAEPFVPFRIHTARGRDYEVPHPEFAQVGRTALTVYAPSEGNENGPLRWEKISLMLVESIAPIDLSAHKNGR